MSSDKEKKLELAIAAIEKEFGKGSIISFDEKNPAIACEAIPTGSISLDKITGIGGFPKGRVSEVFGGESSGKTTLCLHTIANCQKAGGIAAFIDVEHALDPMYAANLGVDMAALKVSQPDSAEEALDIVEFLAKSTAVDIIVVDSVAALVPKAELEGSMDDMQIGLQSRLMGKALRKLKGIVANTHCALIFINQVRTNIAPFGSPTITPGGMALKFYASMRVELARTAWIKEGALVVGSNIRAKTLKNKLHSPYKVCEYPIVHGKGISELDEIIDLGMEYGVIVRGGPYYKLNTGDSIGRGRPEVKTNLTENHDLYMSIKAAIKEEMEEKHDS